MDTLRFVFFAWLFLAFGLVSDCRDGGDADASTAGISPKTMNRQPQNLSQMWRDEVGIGRAAQIMLLYCS